MWRGLKLWSSAVSRLRPLTIPALLLQTSSFSAAVEKLTLTGRWGSTKDKNVKGRETSLAICVLVRRSHLTFARLWTRRLVRNILLVDYAQAAASRPISSLERSFCHFDQNRTPDSVSEAKGAAFLNHNYSQLRLACTVNKMLARPQESKNGVSVLCLI